MSIRPDPYFNTQRQVRISGEVLYPGLYTILSSNEKITDIIDRAGGPLQNAYFEGSKYFRNEIEISVDFRSIIKNNNSNLNFNIRSGDHIIISAHSNTINVIGEVNTQGMHKYVPGKRLKYYLNQAGGLTIDADLKSIWVEYPNRVSKHYNYWSLFSPKVLDGSIINVGKKKDEEPFDRTEYLNELTSIIANLAQANAVMVIAVR